MRVFSLSFTFLLISFQALAVNFQSKNHVHVGFQSYYRDYSEDLVAPAKSDEYGFLYGLLLDYERKAPNSAMFYAALSYDFGDTHYDGGLQGLDGRFIAPFQSDTSNGLFSLETASGYSFTSDQKHIITPYIGIGGKTWGRGLNFSGAEYYGWIYLVAGFQYDYNISNSYKVGINCKIMPMLLGVMDADDLAHEVTLGNKIHLQIGLPIIYKPNLRGKQYWRFTPYYEHQNFGRSDEAPSLYHFNVYAIEPASRTHILGLKLEYAFGFL